MLATMSDKSDGYEGDNYFNNQQGNFETFICHGMLNNFVYQPHENVYRQLNSKRDMILSVSEDFTQILDNMASRHRQANSYGSVDEAEIIEKGKLPGYSSMQANFGPYHCNKLQTNEMQDASFPNNTDIIKQSTLLARYYKPDGSALKSLWDNEADTIAHRIYKYEPKPLKKRKNPRIFVPDKSKSKEYWEKRKKNNLAARRSREGRRRQEIEVLKTVEHLIADNGKLRTHAQNLIHENENLKHELSMMK